MGFIAGFLLVLALFWVLGKLTGKKEFQEFPQRLGLTWQSIGLMVILLAIIIFIVFR